MTSRASPAEPAPQRHTLVTVARDPWRRLVASRNDLAAEPLIGAWADQGWPLILRRPGPGEDHGLALGLPLPPSLGKRRIAVVLQPADVIRTEPPPLLDEAKVAASPSWRDTIARLSAMALTLGEPARVFGSLAWQWITGLPYLTPGSDLDLLLPCAGASRIDCQTAGLAAAEAHAPMRIDAELVRVDGAAVSWRELHSGMDEILVKTTRSVTMIRRESFLGDLPA